MEDPPCTLSIGDLIFGGCKKMHEKSTPANEKLSHTLQFLFFRKYRVPSVSFFGTRCGLTLPFLEKDRAPYPSLFGKWPYPSLYEKATAPILPLLEFLGQDDHVDAEYSMLQRT